MRPIHEQVHAAEKRGTRTVGWLAGLRNAAAARSPHLILRSVAWQHTAEGGALRGEREHQHGPVAAQGRAAAVAADRHHLWVRLSQFTQPWVAASASSQVGGRPSSAPHLQHLLPPYTRHQQCGQHPGSGASAQQRRCGSLLARQLAAAARAAAAACLLPLLTHVRPPRPCLCCSYVLLWIALSAAVILYNKWVLAYYNGHGARAALETFARFRSQLLQPSHPAVPRPCPLRCCCSPQASPTPSRSPCGTCSSAPRSPGASSRAAGWSRSS